MESLLNIVVYALPSLIISIVMMLVVKSFFDKEYRLRQLEFLENNRRQALPLRLQAYERLIMFVERISIHNLLPRVRKADMTVAEFRQELITTVGMEYEHNLSQQLYVSPEAWELIKIAKEEVKTVINRNAMELRPDAPSVDLSRHIINKLAEQEELTGSQKAILQLKKEVMMFYSK
jgi:hypothetical protein